MHTLHKQEGKMVMAGNCQGAISLKVFEVESRNFTISLLTLRRVSRVFSEELETVTWKL